MACEDGDGYCSQPYGDYDDNDLVLQVTREEQVIPLPPSALLLGSGRMGLDGRHGGGVKKS
ncbi:MAG: hypothetical protein WCD80_02565 [Desulfobaccales bacterium]